MIGVIDKLKIELNQKEDQIRNIAKENTKQNIGTQNQLKILKA
jgi:hypothetical protein